MGGLAGRWEERGGGATRTIDQGPAPMSDTSPAICPASSLIGFLSLQICPFPFMDSPRRLFASPPCHTPLSHTQLQPRPASPPHSPHPSPSLAPVTPLNVPISSRLLFF